MKRAIPPSIFLAAFVASANIRPPPCADCRVQTVPAVGPGKLTDFGDEQADLRPRFIAGAVKGAADAAR